MHKTIWIILIILSISCEKECTEAMGTIVQQEIVTDYFDKIIVNSGIELIIQDSSSQKVIIETGENKLDNVYISVDNDVLELQADGSCFLNPSFEAVRVYVNSPNITSIRNSSEYTISSDGVLNYPELKLLTENNQNEYANFGDFYLTVSNNKITVISNGMSIIQISGSTNTLKLYYYNGIGKFEGKDLIVQSVDLFHRGDNSLKVNPQQSLTGEIYSTGNVLSYNHPSVVEVLEHYTGKLIFE